MCPKCRSSWLKIKKMTGLERVIVLLTGQRKYYCLDCGTRFRAPDRRESPRGDDAMAAPRTAGFSLGRAGLDKR